MWLSKQLCVISKNAFIFSLLKEKENIFLSFEYMLCLRALKTEEFILTNL